MLSDARCRAARRLVRWENLDLLLLAALIVLTAALGPSFSKLEIGGTTVYVTEIVLAIVVVVAALRLGVGRGLAALKLLPLLPLGIFWVAGVIATARGFATEGLTNMLEDVGLFEYSLILPVIALTAGSLKRTDFLRIALIAGTAAATVLYLVSYVTSHFLADLVDFRAEALTYGMYMALYVTWIASELAHDRKLPAPLLVLAGFGLVLVFLTSVRAVWMGAMLGLLCAVLVSPPSRRLSSALRTAAAVVAAFAIAVGAQLAETGEVQIFTEVEGVAAGVGARDTTPETEELDPNLGREPKRAGGGGNAKNAGPAGAGPGASTGPGPAPPGAGDQSGGNGKNAGGGRGGPTTTVSPTTPESANTSWRLDFWREAVERTADQPLFGAGFGEPFRFVWNGLKYDFRDGDRYAAVDTSGNHNSFVYVLYRMGIPALLALLALIAVAVARTRGAAADRPARAAEMRALLAMVFAAIGVALWTDALKSPFLALAFWIPLGLLIVTSRAPEGGPPAR